MTEAELVDLGFTPVNVGDDQSDNGYNYYFYQNELCDDLVLYSTDSIDVENNDWTLKCYEIPSIRIRTVEHYLNFVEVLNNIIC